MCIVSIISAPSHHVTPIGCVPTELTVGVKLKVSQFRLQLKKEKIHKASFQSTHRKKVPIQLKILLPNINQINDKEPFCSLGDVIDCLYLIVMVSSLSDQGAD